MGRQVLAATFLTSVDWSLLWPTLISLTVRSVDWSLLLPSADCVLPLTAFSCRLSSSASFFWLCPSLDCSLMPNVLFCSLLLTDLLLDLLPASFRSRGRSRVQALCVGFAPKQRDPLTGTHTHQRNKYPQNSVTLYSEHFRGTSYPLGEGYNKFMQIHTDKAKTKLIHVVNLVPNRLLRILHFSSSEFSTGRITI